jgi:multimeric flavodoxin WrbA
MAKNILIISGSPKRDGNTAILVEGFIEGARLQGTHLTLVCAASLKFKANGCTSCRLCQTHAAYGCVIDDDASEVLKKMMEAQAIVMATPHYFFSASAQLKVIVDRMFSLYKWDNDAGTMKTPLRGKTLVLIASAFEALGLDALREPMRLIADYTGMKFESLLIPGAGVSGEILKKIPDIRSKAAALGEKIAQSL